ncbi:MAG: hypothetical protein ACE5ER_07615 [Nitrospinaceae bacterium]
MNVKILGVADIVVEHGAPKLIRRDLGLDTDGLYKSIRGFYTKVMEQAPGPANPAGEKQGNGRLSGHSANAGESSPAAPSRDPLKIRAAS